MLDPQLVKRFEQVGELMGRRAAILEGLETVESEIAIALGEKPSKKGFKQVRVKITGSIGSGRIGKVKGQKLCKKCGAPGHMAKTCPKGKEKAPGRPGTGTRAERCNVCHTTGSRHFNTCPVAKGQGTAPLKDMSDAGEPHVPQPRVALGPDRYKMIREAMHDREFQSARYALTNKISPAEVNSAIRSTSYDDYLTIR